MPFKKLFQYINEIRQHHDPKAPMSNPADAITAKWLDQLNREQTTDKEAKK